ncbi:hypothetical protein L2744_21130 [Shewanella profunda]|uniref:hypothetical protein n=1 Tax=Shewanella profunda TaxID=254793 RepID=UPI00200C2423|nr:hypothetical protein [Shewanella profunda]MCL1092055.1 hypothetical protein [Shewanella profunda]
MSSSLIGQKVIIRNNDFSSQDLNASIIIINEDKKTVLLELEEPLKNTNTTYRYVVASPRLSKDDLGVLDTTGILGCSVTWVPNDKYDPSSPMDLSWWRGGAATITDLCIN